MGKQYLNGVLYGTGEVIKFSPEIYSLEEREVGVWTNGKPLYQRTFSGSLTPSASSDILFNINTYDIDEIIQADGYLKKSASDFYCVQLGCYLNSNFYSAWYKQGTGNFVLYHNPASYLDTYVITVQYTKATDTPGSGHYTTNGGEAHHYSTSEQIVGTWIDGKPLYERTYIFDTVMSLNSNTWTNTSYNGDFIKGIIDCKGYAENMIPNATLLASKSSNNLIQLLNLRTSPINCRGFTLQYIKTTD